MKQPLQALLVAGRNAQASCDLGRKSISIREGARNYQVGESMVLCCHLTNWCRMAKVTEVRHCTFIQVTDREFMNDGFTGITQALVELKKFYPGMTYDSPVTVLQWELK